MKICFVTSEYPPENPHGGLSTFTKVTARSLAKAGHEVHVLTWTFSADYLEFGKIVKEMVDDVMVHKIVMPPPRLHQRAVMWIPYRAVLLKEVLTLGELDVVQCPDNNADGVFLKLGKYLNSNYPKIVTLCTGTPVFTMKRFLDEMDPSVLMRLLRKTVGLAEKTQIMLSDALLSYSNTAAETTARFLGLDLRRITVISAGIDLAELRTIQPVDLQLPDEYVLYLGRLEARKGTHILAEALRRVFKHNPRLKVILMGYDSPFRGTSMARYVLEMNHEYANNIVVTGFVRSEDEKKTILKAAKFVVYPSLLEGWGYAALEAMALGKTVIVTRNTGLGEIVEDGKSGLCVTPGDSVQLSEAMIYCLQNDISSLERGALRRSEQFDMIRLLPRYEEFYRRVVGQET